MLVQAGEIQYDFYQKNVIVSLIMAFLVMFLVSCKSAERIRPANLTIETEVPSKIKLRFISSWGGVDTKADPLQQVLNSFMEDNPDIEVLNESVYGDDFLHKLKTDFASGYDPDVFGLWPGSDIRALVEAGKVADITYLLEEDKAWKDTFGESEWQFTTYNGRIYGLPLEIIYECLFINRDIFVKYNVKVPRTYDDLKQAITIGISSEGYGAMQLSAKFKECMEALEHKFYIGNNSIIHYKDLHPFFRSEDNTSLENYQKLLSDGIKSGNEVLVKKVLKEITDYIERCCGGISRDSLKNFYCAAVTMINNIRVSVSGAENNPKGLLSKDISSLIRMIDKSDSMKELNAI